MSVEFEKYGQLYGLLSTWRDKLGSKSPYNGILPFVSGLRFSVNILYLVKEILMYSQLDATWGHIMDKDDKEAMYYSPECDIIIFKKGADCVGGHWNGNKTDKSMDFKFIKVHSVVGVISCKSGISVGQVDKKYPAQLKTFTENVWLFAEYCDFNKFNNIKAKALKVGYKDFWCLYEWTPQKGHSAKMDIWKQFDKEILALAKKHESR